MKDLRILPLTLAVAAGLGIAWLDTRPGWDDTGITAGLLFISAAVLGALAQRRPWLIGLLTGVWLPLVMIALTGDARAIAILVFPLAGAYAGAAFRSFWVDRRSPNGPAI